MGTSLDNTKIPGIVVVNAPAKMRHRVGLPLLEMVRSHKEIQLQGPETTWKPAVGGRQKPKPRGRALIPPASVPVCFPELPLHDTMGSLLLIKGAEPGKGTQCGDDSQDLKSGTQPSVSHYQSLCTRRETGKGDG